MKLFKVTHLGLVLIPLVLGTAVIVDAEDENNSQDVQATSQNKEDISVSEEITPEEDNIKEIANPNSTREPNKEENNEIHPTVPEVQHDIYDNNQINEQESKAVIEGKWGTAPISIDIENNVVNIGTGTGNGRIFDAVENVLLPVLGLNAYNYEYSIDFKGKVTAPENSRSLFAIQRIKGFRNFQNFDTSKVTTMQSMFNLCGASEIDISTFNTSKVINMEGMFAYAKATKINIGNIGTTNVTTMQSMFSGTVVESLDLSKIDTRNVENMVAMFSTTTAVNLNIKNFDTNKVLSAEYMFNGCENLVNLEVGAKFNFKECENFAKMFYFCKKLQKLDVSMFNTSSATIMNEMFTDVSSVEILDVSGFDTRNTVQAFRMFDGMKSVKKLDVSGFDTSKWALFQRMFRGTKNLKELDLSNFDTSKKPGTIVFGSNTDELLDGTTSLEKITLGKKVTSLKGTKLPDIDTSSGYTGRWIGVSPSNSAIFTSSQEFMDKFEPNISGTYIKGKNPVINVKSTTIYEKDNWNPGDNFLSGTDEVGGSISLGKITVSGTVNTNVIGVYKVMYSFGSVSQTANVTVKANQTALRTHDSSIYKGETWTAKSNFDSALDKDGNLINYEQYILSGGKVTGNVDTSKPGVYSIIYSYNGINSTVKVTVFENVLKFQNVPQELIFENTKISNATQIVKRRDASWGMKVSDTRKIKSSWRVAAKVEDEMTSTEAASKVLKDAFIYKSGASEIMLQKVSSVTVFTQNFSSNEGEKLTEVSWSGNEGVLLSVKKGEVKSKDYKGSINWELTDAP